MTPLRAKLDFALECGVYAGLYVLFGALSLQTAYLQPNAATIWLPSGFSVGLLLVKGFQFWPCVALGSFFLNGVVNSISLGDGAGVTALLGASLVALGNTTEAAIGAWLAKRLAHGPGFAFRTRSVASFLLVVVLLAPVVSVLGGLVATMTSGAVEPGNARDVALTWYIANAQGILLFGGITTLVLGGIGGLKGRSPLEALALGVALVLAIQIACGNIPLDWLRGWPRPYMLIPFVILATFRFGSLGGLLAVAVITLGMAVGTMNGDVAFPSDTPWRSLIYLQIYLAMLAIIALAMGAALAELEEARSDLENRVAARTRSIERLLERRHVEAALISHDLKSPILGIRNALTAAHTAIAENRASPRELSEVLAAMEQACTTIVSRIVSTLPSGEGSAVKRAATRTALQDIFDASFSAHRPTLQARDITMTLEAPPDLSIAHGSEAEHVIDTLIDNAVRHTSDGSVVRVVAVRRDGAIEIKVIDEGTGISEERQRQLFQLAPVTPGERRLDGGARSGLGLHLAARQAEWIGGRLRYSAEPGPGATFVFSVAEAPGDRDGS